ncbi:MAG: hypothetical protein EXS37_15090 [Opitutus sp.]|nr:hypothetical protein [Opitutus sp.]
MNVQNGDNADQPIRMMTAPDNWQHAHLSSMLDIEKAHRGWLADEAQTLGLRAYLDAKERERNGVAVVFLSAQVRYWKKRCAELDLPENHARARKGVAKAIAEVLLNSFEKPDKRKLGADQKKLGARPTDHARAIRLRRKMFTDLKNLGARVPDEIQMLCYDWRAVLHRGQALRAALGYTDRRFRKLAGQACRTVQNPPRAAPGEENIYARPVAWHLLGHRLNRLNAAKRNGLASSICSWQHATGEPCPEFEKILGVG